MLGKLVSLSLLYGLDCIFRELIAMLVCFYGVFFFILIYSKIP